MLASSCNIGKNTTNITLCSKPFENDGKFEFAAEYVDRKTVACNFNRYSKFDKTSRNISEVKAANVYSKLKSVVTIVRVIKLVITLDLRGCSLKSC